MLENKQKTLLFIESEKHIKTKDIVDLLGVSRQRAHAILSELIREGKIIKIGSTAKASYAIPEYAQKHTEIYPTNFHKTYKNIKLEEDVVFSEVESKMPQVKNLKSDIRGIFRYGFLEMLNNAIEHSQTKNIEVELTIDKKNLNFIINDFGIGIFRNVMKNKGLHSELEAVQDILKGKTTTIPESHSGQGIFFTSKAGDTFTIESFDYQLIINNKIDDIFLKKPKKIKRGTRISFTIALDSERELQKVFSKYANIGEESDYGFDRTEIKIKLYTREGIYLSRSQARRILAGLDKFKSIILDFKKIETIGQAFADEIFRVFHNRYPDIKIISINMNEAVKFMIDRVDTN